MSPEPCDTVSRIRQQGAYAPPSLPLVERLQRAYEIGTAITAIHDLSALVEVAVNRILHDLHYQNVSLFAVEGERLVFLGGSHTSGKFLGKWDLERTGQLPPNFKIGEYVTGQAALRGESVLVPDASRDDRYLAWPLSENPPLAMRSELALPLKIGERVLGVLNIESTTVNAFTEEDQRILGLLVGQIAVALENVRLHEDARRRIRELSELHEELQADILVRREAEQALRDKQAQLAGILETALGAIIVTDAGQRIRIFNAAAEKTFRCSAEEAIGGKIDRFIPERFRRAHRKHIQAFGKTGISRRHRGEPVSLFGLRADGEEFPIEAAISKMTLGGETYFTVILLDITERARAEEELRASEERFRKVFEEAPIGMTIIDLEHQFLRVNAAFCRMTGYAEEELTALGFPDITHPDDMNEGLEAVRRLFNHEIPFYKTRKRYLRKDGGIVWANLVATLIRDHDGDFAYGLAMVEDITEQRQLEEQFHQSQKMEAIGRLAGGVAHDFNNLLTIILGYSEIGLTDRTNPFHEAFTEIKRAGEQASALTRQLLAFSRQQTIQPRILDLNRVVGDSVKMLKRLIGEDIELVTSLDPALGNTKVDPGQIDQIIINLVVNARDAMPEGGTLEIETANEEFDEAFCRRHVGARPGRYVRLRVRDTGTGMDEGTRTRIFEPFFTTKAVGQGTGLGLSTVYGIVKQNEGYIQVESTIGRGSAFTVYLPQAEGALAGTEEPRGRLRTSPPGTGTLLLVEDEGQVRRMLKRILVGAGYGVLEAASGPEALALCEEHDDPIRLMITDVVMPGMSGPVLADRVGRTHPETITLFISGYTDKALAQVDADALFLQKPFKTIDLIRKVQEILEMEGR